MHESKQSTGVQGDSILANRARESGIGETMPPWWFVNHPPVSVAAGAYNRVDVDHHTNYLQRTASCGEPLSQPFLLSLQRRYGNHYSHRIVRQSQQTSHPRGSSHLRGHLVQAKFMVGAAGDKHELEADQVARQVVKALHGPTRESQRQHSSDGSESDERESRIRVSRIRNLQRQLTSPGQAQGARRMLLGHNGLYPRG